MHSTPPPGLKMSIPRDVQLTASGWTLEVFAILFIVGSIVLPIVMHRNFTQERLARERFARESVTADAQVMRLWQTSGDSKRRMVEYRFETPGGFFEGRGRLSREAWRTLTVGAHVPVRYLPADPSESYVGAAGPNAPPLWLPWVLGLGIASLAWLLSSVVRRERRLLEIGRVTTAVVLKHHKHQSSHGGTHRSMTYEFHVLSGAKVTSKSGTSSKPPAIGSVVTILYDPERPKRSQPYPLKMVRPASI